MQTNPDRTPSENAVFYAVLADVLDVRLALAAGRPVPQECLGRLVRQPLSVTQVMADAVARHSETEGYQRE